MMKNNKILLSHLCLFTKVIYKIILCPLLFVYIISYSFCVFCGVFKQWSSGVIDLQYILISNYVKSIIEIRLQLENIFV